MKQIISIENINGTIIDRVLCEWGQQHCCLAGWSTSENRATHIHYFTFDSLSADVMNSTIENIRKISVGGAVHFSLEFPEALLIPAKFNEEAQQLWEQFYSTRQTIKKDSIEQWQAVIAYALPTQLHKLLESHFPSATFSHGFSNSLKVYNGFIPNDSLSVHFTPYNFRVIVRKNGQLILAQIYPYKTPLDVVYYLLKIGEEFSLPKDILYVVVSGLIEESSALYTELTNYFQTVQFAATPAIANTSHPAHYFTSLYNLSACVS